MRRPAVAGFFYPRGERELREELERCFSGVEIKEGEIIGAVAPHAGYMYSGRVAAHTYARIPPAETFIILGPNHQGIGSGVAVSTTNWSTPLGEVEVDGELARRLVGSIIDADESAHAYEHSIEVQIPFLQYRFENPRILPICMGLQDEETAEEVGESIHDACEELGRNAVIIASSDFTHYEPHEVAHEKDMYVIDAILALNPSEFYRRIRQRNASVCGYGPIAAMIHAVKSRAKKCELVKYATSGDVTGDFSQVVGYASIVVE